MPRSIGVALLLILLSAAVQAESLTLKIATLAPAGTTWMNEVQKAAGTITERTEGRVAFKFYPAGVMGGDALVLRKIRLGQLHGGAFGSAGLAQIYPDIQALNLPMLFDSFDEVDYVRARIEPVMKRELLERGFVLLGVGENGFTRIISRAPIETLEAMQASKLWVPQGDRMAREIMLSMGLSPVSLPVADVFTGLQTGLIETVVATPTAAIAFQWHTGAEYITDAPLVYLVGFLAVQKKAFERIGPADRRIVEEEIARAFVEMDRLTRLDNVDAVEALKNRGVGIVTPSETELARWQQLSAQSVETLIDKGALTREGVARVKQHLEHYRSLHAQTATAGD